VSFKRLLRGRRVNMKVSCCQHKDRESGAMQNTLGNLRFNVWVRNTDTVRVTISAIYITYTSVDGSQLAARTNLAKYSWAVLEPGELTRELYVILWEGYGSPETWPMEGTGIVVKVTTVEGARGCGKCDDAFRRNPALFTLMSPALRNCDFRKEKWPGKLGINISN